MRVVPRGCYNPASSASNVTHKRKVTPLSRGTSSARSSPMTLGRSSSTRHLNPTRLQHQAGQAAQRSAAKAKRSEAGGIFHFISFHFILFYFFCCSLFCFVILFRVVVLLCCCFVFVAFKTRKRSEDPEDLCRASILSKKICRESRRAGQPAAPRRARQNQATASHHPISSDVSIKTTTKSLKDATSIFLYLADSPLLSCCLGRPRDRLNHVVHGEHLQGRSLLPRQRFLQPSRCRRR